MTNHEISIQTFTVEHPLRGPDDRGLLGCMDRRRVVPSDPVLGGDKLFQQIRGGRYGIGHGLALAMEATGPGSFTDLGMPVADFAQGLGFALELNGILTTKHGPTCGAIEGATVIHDGVAAGEYDEAMFANALRLNPDLTEKHYLRTVAAAKRISKLGLASTPDEVKTALTTPAGVIPKSTAPHVELQDTNHDTIRFVTDYRPGVALDRAAAHASGFGAYYSSFGDLEGVRSALPTAVRNQVSLETWWATEAVVLGRIATHDITAGGTPYDIETIGR
ncbi:MAG TPA: hypothetical protein VLF59_04070 [Candidatus Saccharimonadales bacterium]|nr:hypothetical protein [Candidatus Saccharimonadales bacterium]